MMKNLVQRRRRGKHNLGRWPETETISLERVRRLKEIGETKKMEEIKLKKRRRSYPKFKKV